MLDLKSIYPKLETGYVFTKNMKDELVEKFNGVIFNRGSALFKKRILVQKKLILQSFPVKK